MSDLGVAAPRDLPDLLRSVVYLESAPRGAFETNDGGRAVMDQRNETFVPHVLAIMTGTTVDFPNSDPIYHNVFSLSKTSRFDLGRYAAGRSKSVRFDKPGIVRVFCDIHSHMNAYILVFSHPFFALTRADGRYGIDQRAGRHLQRDCVERGHGLRAALRHGARRRRRRAGFHAQMRILSSLRSRIFLASALLAMLCIGVAIYLVSQRVTEEAEQTLEREMGATAAQVDHLRVERARMFTLMARLIADLPKLKAGHRHQRSADVEVDRR